jgi:D-galacturonate reductase
VQIILRVSLQIDARDRIQKLGGCSFFQAYMSQPKHQLETFAAWAGKSSVSTLASLSAPLALMLILTAQDISYYLNSHHVDFHEWCLLGKARPTTVTAIASTGVAKSKGIDTEDTITLTVQWKNLADGTLASAVLPPNACPYTANFHSVPLCAPPGSSIPRRGSPPRQTFTVNNVFSTWDIRAR